jgi:endonuclease/exonuclease/phosphatase family metal-dependent hydrolase
MMPAFSMVSPKNTLRARAIGAELLKHDAHILCLEKAFDGGAREVLRGILGARYPHRYGPVNKSGGLFKTNGGVWILSQLPLRDYHEIEFSDNDGVESFSRKGAMILTGSLGGSRFQVVGTHLQGDDGPFFDPDKQEVRDKQLHQLSCQLLARFATPTLPLFVCGDFCTPKYDPNRPAKLSAAYGRMLETLRVADGPGDRITLDDRRAYNDIADDNRGRQAELDYILVRSNGHAMRGTWERKVFRHDNWDGAGHRDLSYRYAVTAAVTF